MPSKFFPKQIPIYPSDEVIEVFQTCRALSQIMFRFGLSQIEHPLLEFWQEKQALLAAHGYRVDPYDFYDVIGSSCYDRNQPCPHCEVFRPETHGFHLQIPATRISDKESVVIEWMETASADYILMTRLSSPQSRMPADKPNLSLPLLDTFPDPDLDDSAYVVMPLSTSYPNFATFDEMVFYIDWMLEGLVRLHEQGVACCFCPYDGYICSKYIHTAHKVSYHFEGFGHARYIDAGLSESGNHDTTTEDDDTTATSLT